jgi:RNA polymerase subunit RPABC4/transcription elongation factor Spt4
VSPAQTHGDLIVTAGEVYTIQPTSGTPLYYQGGNITVLAGGTLDIQNVSVVFAEFVADTGTPMERLSHIFTFTDDGTVNMVNSSVTTDLGLINAYAKLNMVVTGNMTLWKSALEFPGWVTVAGAAADLTLNQSAITANPQAAFLNQPLAIQGDIQFAPSLLVDGGAALNLFDSTVTNTYADDTSLNGYPAIAPLTTTDVSLDVGGTNVTQLATPTDSANLSLDWLYYPVPIPSGDLVAFYNDSAATSTVSDVQIWYEGIAYPVGSARFVNDTLFGVITLALPPALIAAINAGGLLSYLNNTGDFGPASQIALNFSAPTSGPAFVIDQVGIQLAPPLQYNLVATGAGTTVSTVDSTIGLTFQTPPTSPLSQQPPLPWNSNKFLFSDGATGYLGNLSVQAPLTGVFGSSAILTDPTSTVYLYRWAQFNLTSASEDTAVAGVSAVAFYSYNDNQLSNHTANTINDIESANPAMWRYLQFWDFQHGAPSYGVSNLTGQASLLLASSEINSSSLPTGTFLGGYHVGFQVPYVVNSTWVSAAVRPYPTGVALDSPGYGEPDLTRVVVATAAPVVQFVTFNVPTSPLDLNNQYFSSGTISLNGPGSAVIEVIATPVGGGTSVILGTDTDAVNGSFDFAWTSPLQLSAGTSYNLQATATYKTATPAVFNFPIVYSVPATTSATGFLYEKFLGLPLWLWLVIAAAAVVAILVVLLVFRRQAAGKLVECGECGELIPEDATVCPKCGAEFESDLVRCSRCSSTIPADSQFCPECSAQLLGKPGEDASDPERQAYMDFTEKFRAEGKKELGDNYTESSFWDWWKRQPTYVPFSQWKVQQTKGTPRPGMSQPPVGSEVAPVEMPLPKGSAPAAAAPAPGAGAGFTAPPAAATAPASTSAGALKPCPNCGKEIPPEYLVCPFCGAVTQ